MKPEHPVLDSGARMKTIVVAGTCSGVGKSTIAAGLMAAYSRRGLRVQPFKVGPDFLDPLHHAAATGRQSYNLDTWMLSREANLTCFRRSIPNTDLAIVEGIMGLYDGYDCESERGSTAEMAKLLCAPVVLVSDSRVLARSAAAMLQGFLTFDQEVKFAGVILNKVGGPSQTANLQQAFSLAGIKVPIFGGIPKVAGLEWFEQHNLSDWTKCMADVQELADLVELHVDLDAVLEGAATCNPESSIGILGNETISRTLSPRGSFGKHVRIGIAQDAAFCFQYHENLFLLQDAGAELVYFSPLEDPLPSNLDAILFGGGHIGLYLDQLSANKQLLYGVRAFAEAGGTVYGEASGLMYLSQGVEGPSMQTFPMSGVFSFWTRFGDTLKSKYVKVIPREDCILFQAEIGEIKAFLYSSSQVFFREGGSAETCCRGLVLQDEITKELEWEGYTHMNAMSTLVHIHFASNPRLAYALVDRCRMNRTRAPAVAAASASAVAVAGPEAAAAAGAAAAEAVLAALGDSMYYGSDPSNRRDDDSSPLETCFCSQIGRFEPAASFQKMRSNLRRTESFDLHKLRKATSIEVAECKLPRSESATWNCEEGRNTQLATSLAKDRKAKKWFLDGSTFLNQASVKVSPTYRHTDSAIQQGGSKRIVSLLPWVTQILTQLGAGNRLVAITDICEQPRGVSEECHIVTRSKVDALSGSGRTVQKGDTRPYLASFLLHGGSKLKLDVSWLDRVKPDLVVTEGNDDDRYETKHLTTLLTQAGLLPGKKSKIHVFSPYRMSEAFDFMLDLGDAVGLYAEASLLVCQLRARLRKVVAAVANQPWPRVLLLQGLNPLFVGGHWVPEMEQLAGGYDGLQKPGCGVEMLHWQRIISYAPEVLVLSPCTLSMEQTLCEVELLARFHGFWSIPAVAAGRVYVCRHGCFSSPGPDMVNGIELLASLLHPFVTAAIQVQEIALKLCLSYGQRCTPEDLAKHFKPCN